MTQIVTKKIKIGGREWETFDHITEKELSSFISLHPHFLPFFDFMNDWTASHHKGVVISSILTSREDKSIRKDPWHSTLKAIDLAFVDPEKKVLIRRVPMARNQLLINSLFNAIMKTQLPKAKLCPMIGIESDHFHIEYGRYPNSIVIYNDHKTSYANRAKGIENIIPLS